MARGIHIYLATWGRAGHDEGTRGEVGSRAAEPSRPSPPLPPGAKTRGQARSSRRRRGPSEGRRPPGRPPLSGATPPPVGYFTRILLPRSPATIPRSLGRRVSRSTFLCAGGVCPATPVFGGRPEGLCSQSEPADDGRSVCATTRNSSLC
ncbi:hypothetical protein MRX96_026295 [Rhipicephalus microplus]